MVLLKHLAYDVICLSIIMLFDVKTVGQFLLEAVSATSFFFLFLRQFLFSIWWFWNFLGLFGICKADLIWIVRLIAFYSDLIGQFLMLNKLS